jgi:SAM-dependent methyltransferase
MQIRKFVRNGVSGAREADLGKFRTPERYASPVSPSLSRGQHARAMWYEWDMAPVSADRRCATAPSRPQPNYFNSTEVAARYARVRPFYHRELAERLRGFAGIQRFRRALDVGCGSGQSSVALAEIAEEVTAIDPSPSMLAAAQPRTNVRYRLGAAEHLQIGAGEFDLVSAGSALHWFDQERFYGECRKVLSNDGLLAIYNDHFTAHMQGSVACKRWMRTRFAKRYPAPRRGMRDMDELRAAGCGFTVAHRGSFSHVVRFSREEFIAYLLTRSNTLAALANGRETELAMLDWLDSDLAPIVGESANGGFIFKCNYWIMRRA